MYDQTPDSYRTLASLFGEAYFHRVQAIELRSEQLLTKDVIEKLRHLKRIFVPEQFVDSIREQIPRDRFRSIEKDDFSRTIICLN